MTIFNISKKEADEIRDNLYRDHYLKAIEFEKAEEVLNERTIRGYTYRYDPRVEGDDEIARIGFDVYDPKIDY